MDEKKKKERKLSKAEQKRKEDFEKLTEKLTKEGYKSNHITMSALAGNIYAFVAVLPVVAPLLILYFIMWNEISLSMAESGIACLVFIVLVVVHEFIHGVTWSFFTEKGWKSIAFGFILKYLTPYCHCSEPMKKHQIIIGALMPTIILGIVPAVVAILCGSSFLMTVGILMIYGGGGDILVTYKLLRYRSDGKDVLFIDHPYEIGTAVFDK